MRWNHFKGSLLFAACAALSLPAAWHLLAPVLGAHTALGLYAVSVSALYVLGIAPGGCRVRGRRGAAALAVAVAGAVALGAGASLGGIAVVCLTALGVARSAILYEATPARAFVIEGVLGLGSLALARWLAPSGTGVVGVAAALWGVFLVQSLYFLAPGTQTRESEARLDPFERARRRMVSLLEEDSA